MWIARDKDGSLWLYEVKPTMVNGMWTSPRMYRCADITAFDSVLTEVTWENSPKELIIKN